MGEGCRGPEAAPDTPHPTAYTLTVPEMVGIFVRTGALAFGGGASTLAMLHDEFCVRRPVLSEEEFQLLFGLTRLVPGMNLLSLTVLLGYRTAGVVGSLLALFGLTVPSFAIIILGCLFLRREIGSPVIAGAVRGLSIGAAMLVIVTSGQICQGALKPLRPRVRGFWIGLMLLGAALTVFRTLNAAWIVVAGGALGVLLSVGERER